MSPCPKGIPTRCATGSRTRSWISFSAKAPRPGSIRTRSASPARRSPPPTASSSPARCADPSSRPSRSSKPRRPAIKDIGYEQEGFHWRNAEVEVLAARAVRRHRPGRRRRRQQGRGRGRPGHHVRLRLPRDARAHAGPALLRPQDSSRDFRGASRGRREDARSGRQEPGDGALRERQAGRGDPDRRFPPARRRGR